MCMCVSAITIRVFVAFSIVNLVLPFCKDSSNLYLTSCQALTRVQRAVLLQQWSNSSKCKCTCCSWTLKEDEKTHLAGKTSYTSGQMLSSQCLHNKGTLCEYVLCHKSMSSDSCVKLGDRSVHVTALGLHLDVLDLKDFNIKIIQPQQSYSVCNIKACMHSRHWCAYVHHRTTAAAAAQHLNDDC